MNLAPLRRTATALAALTAAALTLTACGSTQPAVPEPTATGGAAISVTDVSGQTVTLPRPATRVVTLEWVNTENVLALGVQPVGSSDPKGYAAWGGAVPLGADVPDIGQRTEPNVEAIAKVQPDLILGTRTSIPEGALDQLKKIAPVALLAEAKTSDPIGVMKQNFTDTAKLLGKEQQAATVLSQFDAAQAKAKADIAAKGDAGRPFVFSYANPTGSTLQLRMHGPGSLPVALATSLGYKPAWTAPGDAEYGMSDADFEALSKLPDTTLFTWWDSAEAGPQARAILDKNRVWQDTSYVKAGHSHFIAKGVWVYGGPRSAMKWFEALEGVAGK